MLFIIKVTTNKEERALEMISDRATKKNINIFSIAKPHGLKGYIILEAADRESAEEAAFNLPYVKGIIGKTITYVEIQQMLEPKVEAVNIALGDIVEMIGQTFKGEKAKVTRIDKQKGEVVVSLLGASVPIPVTVKIDNVKVIRREKSDDEDEDKDENSTKEKDSEEDDLLI
ncbi:transcription elongation factor Spt5 [Candidatus Pacearchaeota archaeon]|nr:transcription elongation factor Spt5 [Candidatus Pacearchaeota archaeon]